MFPQKCRDLKPLLGCLNRSLTTMGIEISMRPIMGAWSTRSPCATCLYGTSSRRIITLDTLDFFYFGVGFNVPVKTHIGGQALEQRPRVTGFTLVFFCAIK